MNGKTFLYSLLYRWCDDDGGGLVYASSAEDAKEKLFKKFKGTDRDLSNLKIWPWKNDDYFDAENNCVLDIY